MLRPESSKRESLLSARLRVNIPAALLIFLIFLGSQTYLLLGLYDSPTGADDRQFFALWFGPLAHAVLGLLGITMVLGAVTARMSAGWRGLVWTLAVIISTLFIWEAIAYSMVGLHLNNAARLLWENVFTDKQIMRERTGTLVAFIGGYILALPFGTILQRVLEPRLKMLAREATVRSLAAPLAASLLIALCAQLILRATIEQKVYRASVDRQLSLGKLWQHRDLSADALFEIQDAWFKAPPRPEAQELTALTINSSNALPDIFIVVGDSVRRDAVTTEITPHLAALEKESLPIQKAVANANGTHPSLTAIIHSLHPLYHGVYFGRDDYPGSLPIRLLKKLGYEINVLASPDLEYFKFAKVAFSRDQSLADFFLDQRSFVKGKAKSAGEIDRLIVDETIARLARPRQRPRFFFLFFDSTHFEYSWPQDFDPPFKPYAERVPRIPTRMNEDEVARLRNRYWNSVAYVDSLVGKLISSLQKSDTWNNTLFVFTGDHGEEFMERGHLFHGGELNRYQLNVPLLMRFPGHRKELKPVRLASHVDIFPTIFDFIGLSGEFTNSLSGASLIGRNTPEWTVSVISAWGKQWFPVSMAIDTGDCKLMLTLSGSRVLGRSLVVERVIGTHTRDAADNATNCAPPDPERQGPPAAFAPALKELIVSSP